MIRAFVPGKIILAGEHAAVYGKMALAASIDRGVTVTVGGSGDIDYSEDSKGLIRTAIGLAGGDKALSVHVKSDLPIGSGLGSSAALSAAVIKGVREYLGDTISNDDLFSLTMECEKIAHGTPSGLDPATVIYGGLIAFTKGQPIERLSLKKSLPILILNSGNPTELSREMIVDVVGGNTQKEPIIEKIGQVTVEMKTNLVNGEDITPLVTINGELLEELGVVGKRAQKLSLDLRKFGYGVKISGAGGLKAGSGMMIVVGNDFAQAQKLLDSRDIPYFLTMIGAT